MIVGPAFKRVLFALCPTGKFCREDRCQSYFEFELIPSMRAPLEECQGAAGAVQAGAEALIIDAPAENLSEAEFINRVAAFDPDLISLSITFGSLEQDLVCASKLRHKFPDAKIALRGAPCYVWQKELLTQHPDIDLCVRGDYEIAFHDLTANGLKAAGVTFRSATGSIIENPPPLAANLDTLPFPNRSSIKQELYTVRGSKHPQATIHVQRGCPFPCTFCLVHTVSGNKARHRSADSIVSEIQEMTRAGIKHFYLRAETFTLDRAWAITVCEAIAEKCPHVQWVTATRIECVDEKVIAAMKRAGCYGISFGVDVASEKIGKLVKKMPRPAEAKNAMRLCDKYKIISLAYIMIGFVWDTKETIREAERFIRAIRADLLTVHFAHPYPGTEYYKLIQESGVKITSLLAQSSPAFSLPQLSTKILRSLARRIIIRHYLRPSVVFSILSKLLFPKVSALKQESDHLQNLRRMAHERSQ